MHHFVGLLASAAVDGDDVAWRDLIDSVVTGDSRYEADGSGPLAVP